ncbi:MAG: hypothetical protein NTY96_08420 [Bacteroidetes bacterium]|nr:hypothetical protein [Bacteroidota bacterium]
MYRFLLILLISPLNVFSQVIPLQDRDIPQALISHTAVLTSQDFRDYMKGSGEVFLEYGFRSLLVQDLRWQTGHVVLEAYEMADPCSAYGIFSVSLASCRTRDTLTSFDCFSPGGYQAAYGRFYLRITTDLPSPADKGFFGLIARKFISNNPDSLFQLPSVFIQDLIRRFGRDPWCTKGVLGVQHTPVPWQDLFTLVRNTMFVVILPFDRDVYFARINFTSQSDKNTFLKRAGLMDGFTPVPNTTTQDGLYREYRQIDDTNIYFLECQLPFSISSIVP